MSLFESIILGLVQGLTEFLPISSSGHLVITKSLFDVKTGDLVFEVLVHFGTMISVIIYFREKLLAIFKSLLKAVSSKDKSDDDQTNIKLALFIIIGTIPAGILGLLFKDFIATAFDTPKWASGMLLVTAAILIATRWFAKENRNLNLPRSVAIGIAQALAIMPGISRSGSTIAVGLFSGVKKSEAAEFSFLLSLPAIAGATLLEIPDFIKAIDNGSLFFNYVIGATVAGVVGYFSIVYLMALIKLGKFFYFGIYCAIVGILGIILL